MCSEGKERSTAETEASLLSAHWQSKPREKRGEVLAAQLCVCLCVCVCVCVCVSHSHTEREGERVHACMCANASALLLIAQLVETESDASGTARLGAT